jgi:hypothetical protein
MAKTKRKRQRKASNSEPATASEIPKRKRGRPRKDASLAAAVPSVANGSASNGTSHPARMKTIEIPRVGPGRRRIVPAESIEGLAAQLANDLAAELTGRLVRVAEKMVRRGLEDALSKLHG